MIVKNKNQSLTLGMSALFLMGMLALAGCQSQTSPVNPTPPTPPSSSTENADTITSGYSAADRANYQAAMELKDASYCTKISDKNYQQSCKDQLADALVLQQALAKNDASLCEKITVKDNQEACKITIEANLKKSQQEKDQEARINAMQKLRDEIIAAGDYTRCKEITDENFRSVCELQILTNKAFATKDPSWCDKASTSDLKAKCKEIIK